MNNYYDDITDIILYTKLIISENIAYNKENIQYIIDRLSNLKSEILQNNIDYTMKKKKISETYTEIYNNNKILEILLKHIKNNIKSDHENAKLSFFIEKFTSMVDNLTF